MPPVHYLDEPHRLTVEIHGYVNHHPGNLTHHAAMLESYLRGKGIPTKQEWKNGEPVHAVVFDLGTLTIQEDHR